MTPAPPPFSRPSSRAQHAERNVRLDPQGIYGTRSARRQSQLRRRRQFQNGLLWVIGALGLIALGRWALQPRQSERAANQTVQLPFQAAGVPVVLGSTDLLFTSQSGGLWRAKTSQNVHLTAPRRLFSAGVAPAATPLVTAQQIFWPGGDGTLVALDAATGRVQWQKKLPSALVARPALVEVAGLTSVIAGDDAGHIAAYNAQNGLLQWKAALGGAVGEGIGVVAAPGVAPAVLIPLLAGAATRGGLVCLDAKTGARRWSFPGDARSQSAGVATPAVTGNRVFWCNDEGAVVCLEGTTGRKIWKNFAAPLTASPASGSDLVMLRGAPLAVPVAGIVAVGGNDGVLRAFDLATGASRWTQQLGGALHFAAQPLRFEGKNALLLTGEMPAVFLIDAQNGSVLRRWTTTYRNSQGVAFTSERVYSLDADGHLQVARLQ